MNAAVEMTHCPDHETLSAFVDGKLPPDECTSVMEHVAGCAECRDVVLTKDALDQEAGISEQSLVLREKGEVAIVSDANLPVVQTNVVPMRRRWVLPAAGVAAAAAIVFVFRAPAGDELLAAYRIRTLAAATKKLDVRPIVARPSVDIAYKPAPVVLRGPGDEDDLELAPLFAPGADIEEALQKHRSVTNLHHYGVVMLLTKDTEGQAVQYLEEALRKQTGRSDIAQAIAASVDAGLVNDLAAAYYVDNDPKAAKAAERAWQLKKSPPIAWNRALALDTKAAWDDYLKLDSSSPWAAEAREKHDQIGN